MDMVLENKISAIRVLSPFYAKRFFPFLSLIPRTAQDGFGTLTVIALKIQFCQVRIIVPAPNLLELSDIYVCFRKMCKNKFLLSLPINSHINLHFLKIRFSFEMYLFLPHIYTHR